MVTAAVDLVGEPVFAVVGGFHLLSHSAGDVDRIVEQLRQLGVERCGPAHCTGEAATARMRAAFADGFIEMGVGSIITF
jgi:7,8-dihydropterin-6-yl-methyl-4-(beta-D-ribofuranosyl)aminobenzene 5'-phosphate synthase